MSLLSRVNSFDKMDAVGRADDLICNMSIMCLVIVSMESVSNVLSKTTSIFFWEKRYNKTAQSDWKAQIPVASS
jgi:hypothetical protein